MHIFITKIAKQKLKSIYLHCIANTLFPLNPPKILPLARLGKKVTGLQTLLGDILPYKSG